MTEQAQHIGERGIGVQNNGSKNTVTIYAGAAELVLDLRHKLKAPPETERDLLLTELRATTLVGRAGDLAQLEAWLNTSRFIAARGLTGRAGTGKTRLAIELCERAEAAGWIAGFARQDELRRFFDAKSLTAWRWNKPILVVVDYAAASAAILREWLAVLASRRRQANEPSLRLLLLERYAEPGMGWWDQVFKPASMTGRGPDDLLDPARVTLQNGAAR